MKKKIAVLMGGRSLEREVSLKSGQRISEALIKKGYSVTQIDLSENFVDDLIAGKFDLVYIALHGKYGEDGTIQELLDILDIPYTGPNAYANILSFDKILSKKIFQNNGIPTPKFHTLSAEAFKEMGAASALSKVVKKIGIPLVVKPSQQGSALGIKIVSSEDELANALISALSYGKKVLLEQYIKGTEVAVSIIGKDNPRTLPIVEIAPRSGFFDFRSMYTPGMTDYFIPARLSIKVQDSIARIALKVHKVLECDKLSRVDIIVGEDGIPYVLELNTSPGMTETSLLPMAAHAEGIEFNDLVEMIVKMSIQ
jgi:D-alanine-D-alanine ligase